MKKITLLLLCCFTLNHTMEPLRRAWILHKQNPAGKTSQMKNNLSLCVLFKTAQRIAEESSSTLERDDLEEFQRKIIRSQSGQYYWETFSKNLKTKKSCLMQLPPHYNLSDSVIV